VKSEMVQTTAQPAERGFSVEVRVQADAFDGEVSSATASESWAVRAAVLGEGQAELLARYRIAKAAADPDPWRERHDPATPKQFEELDTEALLVGPPAGGAR